MQWWRPAAFAISVVVASSPHATLAAAVDPRLGHITSLLEAGAYEDAEVAAEALFSEGRSQAGGPSLAARTAYVRALLANGKGGSPSTLALARTLVPEKTTARDAAAGTRLRLLGLALLEAAHYRAAADRFQEAVRIHERLEGASREVAEDLDGLATSWYWLDRFDEGLAATRRAQAARESAAPTASAGLQRTLGIRALIWQRKGERAKALADLERAVTLAELVAPAHPDTAVLLSLYGDALAQADDFGKARTLLDRSLRIMHATLRPGHPELASALRPLAIALHEQDGVEAAKAMRQRALGIAEQAYGRAHPLVALQLNDLVASLVGEGDYIEARRNMQRALAIYEQRLGPHHTYTTTAVYNLGVLNTQIGDFAEAAALQRRAITTWQRTAGASHPFLAWALAGLAEARAGQGRHGDAVRYYVRSLAIRERNLGPSHTLVAYTLTPLAASLVRLGHVRRASDLSERALRIWEASPTTSDGLAEGLLVRAEVHVATGRHQEAASLYERFLTLRRPIVGARHPSIAEGEAGLGRALAALRRGPEAVAAALRAEALGRDHLRLTASALAESQALTYAATRPRGLDQALSLLTTVDAASDVFDAVVRGRALVLDEMAMRRRLGVLSTGTELEAAWRELTAARRHFANLAVRGPDDRLLAAYTRELDAARRVKERLEATWVERSRALRDDVHGQDIGLQQVGEAMPPGSTLVSFVRFRRDVLGQHCYMAFVLRAGETAPRAIELGSAAAIDAAVRDWRRALRAGLSADGVLADGTEAIVRRRGTALRRALWDPVVPFLGNARHVFVVPEATLNVVSFAALPAGRSQYLIDAPYAVHYLTAERDLHTYRSASRGTGRGLLALGGPAYGPTAPATRNDFILRGVTASGGAAPLVSACVSLRSLAFDGLPMSAREARDVARLWPRPGAGAVGAADPIDTLLGPAANEAAFKRLGPGRRVLHVATHGFFLDGACVADTGGAAATDTSYASSLLARNPLVLSGLALAGANRRRAAPAGADDNILTAEEVATLDLEGVEWAVLSACDTGLGSIKSGEGVFGLRRAFEIAGARTVIMSLWSVEDRASRDWMRALYEGRLRDGLSTIDAVREASRAVLRDRRARRLSTHPFYWAGFVAAGDWR